MNIYDDLTLVIVSYRSEKLILKNLEEEVQKSTDDNISLIEKILSEKEKEILTI